MARQPDPPPTDWLDKDISGAYAPGTMVEVNGIVNDWSQVPDLIGAPPESEPEPATATDSGRQARES